MAYSDWRPVSIPLVGGVDTKTDEKTVAVGKLVKLENGIFEEHGSLTRRIGYDTISDSQIDVPETVMSYKDELLYSADSNLYSKDGDDWVNKGYFEHSISSAEFVAQIPEEQTHPDRCENENIRGYVWATSAGIYYSIQDVETGQWLVNNSQLDDTAGTLPRCVAVDNNLIFLWAVTGSTNIEYATVNQNDPTNIQASGTLISDMHADGVFSVAARESFYFVAYKSTATNDIRVARVSGTSVDKTEDTNEASVGSSLVNLVVGDDHCILVYTSAATIRAAEFAAPLGSFEFVQNGEIDNSLSLVYRLAPALVSNNDSETEDVVLWYMASGNIQIAQFKTDLTEIETGAGLRNTIIISQAFVYDDVAYVVGQFESELKLQNSYFLLRAIQYLGGGTTVEKARVVGQFGLGEAPDKGASRNHLPSVVVDTKTAQMVLPARRRFKLETENNQNTSNITFTEQGLKRFDINFTTEEYNPAEIGDGLYVPGTLTWLYDGVNLGEAQPLLYPEPDITIGGTTHSFVSEVNSGGSIPIGTYGYKIYYERRTHHNEVIRSSAIPFSFEVTGNNTVVTIVIPTLLHTQYDDWYIVVYRTTDGGVTYHRITDVNPENNTGSNRWIDNDRDALTVSFDDELADTSITANDLDPLSGGVLANIQIPGAAFFAKAKKRVFAAGGEIPDNRVYYTKIRNDGVGVELNDQLFFDVDEDGGPITALAALNDQIIVFKRNRIYTINGDGPSNLGVGQFSEPYAISTDSGCTRGTAVVEMPLGLMYKSAKGIYTLGQNLRVGYVGAPVESFNNLNTVSAQLLPDQNAVLFLHSDGVALYYDYNFDQWSTFTGHQGIAATVWQNRFAYLAADGTVYFQDATNYRDGNRPYVFKARTAPIRMGGLQEFWRARLLLVVGEYFTAHKFKVDAYFNRDRFPRYSETKDPSDFIDTATWGDQATWGADNVWGGDGRDYQMDFRLHPQKCQTISFEFTEIPDSANNGQSFQLTELALEWAPLPGLGRLASTRKS